MTQFGLKFRQYNRTVKMIHFIISQIIYYIVIYTIYIAFYLYVIST